MPLTKAFKFFRYFIEGSAAYILFFTLAILPLPIASWTLGAVFRLVGPKLKAHARAKKQLAKAMPKLASSEIDETINLMWWHLGRLAGEYPNLPKLSMPKSNRYIEIVGLQNIKAAKNDKNGAIFMTGHIGNWEIIGNVLADESLNLGAVYRAANNPIVNNLIIRTRKKYIKLLFPKGKEGARKIINHLKSGGQICMLIDQKMNDGIPISFFNREAMTAPALAELALKYNCSIWPIRVERLKNVNFRVTVYPSLKVTRTKNHTEDVCRLMQESTTKIENWISERPEQWLWPHRRWRD